MPERVYFDWNATAPLHPRAREAMLAALERASEGILMAPVNDPV